MRYGARLAITWTLAVGAATAGLPPAQAQPKPGPAPRDYPVQPVPFTAVHVTDTFWRPRIEINRTVTIPFAFDMCEQSKRIYREGEAWKPVEASGPFGVEKDRYNKGTFAPVTTAGLRLEVVLPQEWSAGLQEWKVN